VRYLSGIRLRCWGISRLGFWIDSRSLIRHISDISIVVVSSVFHMLSAAVRESYRVRSGNSTGSVRGLSSIEVSLRVVISNSVLVGVGCGLLLLMVSRGGMISRRRGMVGRGSMDHRSSMHHRSMISWSSVHHRSSMISWSLVDYRGSMISRCMMNNWGSMVSRSWCMVRWSSMIGWGRGMVSWSSMVSRDGSISMSRESSWSMNSSRVLLIASIAMDRLWSSVGLTDDRSVDSAMGFVDRVTH